MKSIKILAAFLIFFQFNSFGQSWESLEESQSKNINGLEVSYILSYIKDKQGEDVYQVTATISNNGTDMIHHFATARYSFEELPQNAWAHFRFTNATGKALSSREGYIYPNPVWMSFPYKCDPKQKNDEYADRVIGVGLQAGESKTNQWRVRVDKGSKPQVMVLIMNN